MEELLQEYRETLRNLKASFDNAPVESEDKKILSGMISDVQYAIDWIRKGHIPENRRGIERRASYQRNKPFDPLVMQKYFRSVDSIYGGPQKESVINEWDKVKIEDALSVLSMKEKEVYLMKRGQGLSYGDIANYLCVSTSTVQTMIDRGEKKIQRQKKRESLLHLRIEAFFVCLGIIVDYTK